MAPRKRLTTVVSGLVAFAIIVVQAGAVTFTRFSMQTTPTQNIPIRTDLGRTIRRGFVATSLPLSIDYAALELRYAAAQRSAVAEKEGEGLVQLRRHVTEALQ